MTIAKLREQLDEITKERLRQQQLASQLGKEIRKLQKAEIETLNAMANAIAQGITK